VCIKWAKKMLSNGAQQKIK
jgi:hypothetical protein